jgi:hypothetical protein
MRHLYHVEPFHTGFFSGTLNQDQLKKVLNTKGEQGWRLDRIISERRRVLLFFSREAHFLIFSFVGDDKSEELLRQLLRAYGHEPEV